MAAARRARRYIRSGVVIYTIGHSTRTLEEFERLLAARGIVAVVDVRRYPVSRRYPHFAGDALAAALGAVGIEYRHEPDLGGRRTARADSLNTAWRSPGFRGYADHMETPPFQQALTRLIAHAAAGLTAVVCAEAVPWRCHRQLIADALVARGIEVRHIIGPGAAGLHRLSPHAQVLPEGRLRYPLSPVGRLGAVDFTTQCRSNSLEPYGGGQCA